MSRIEKLIGKFLEAPVDFTWNDLVVLLNHFGYKQMMGNGSRRKFIHENYQMIILHEPHPRRVLKVYQVKQIIEILKEEDLI